MPTDNRGDKWACEACVRGHRATKCEHFDRWMVRVKKPGRPLRDCPHVNGPCTCMDDKVIMMRVPRRQQRGGCTCRVLRTFDPNFDDYSNPRSRQPPRPQNSLGSTSMNPYSSTQYQTFAQHIEGLSTSARTANGQDVGAELSHGHPLQDTMRPQQPASDPSSSDQATLAATLTTLTQGSQVPQQVQSQSVAQPRLPTPSFSPDINSYSSNLQLPPAQLQFPLYSPDQPAMNGIHGQHTPDISTFTNPPNTSYGLDPAHPLTMAQSSPLGPGYQYPGPDDSFPIISAGEPSAGVNALTDSQNCLCGPGCNCAWCATHPYNDATRERVQDLDRILADDGYSSRHLFVQPQPAYVAASTNGTSTEPVMANELLLPDEGSFRPALSEWMNFPTQSSASEVAVDGNTSVDNGDHSNGFSPQRMRNSGYVSLEYPVSSSFTDATGTCLCGSDSRCLGCLTHQGQSGLPN